MAVQSITNINIDFYDKNYTLINAKQLDKRSRFLLVTCYNHGEICRLYTGEHSAYIRYKKPDGYCVFNFCEIDTQGRVRVEITEQMLACAGICYADLVIVNKKSAIINPDTGEIVVLDNASIISTMTFCIDVTETAVENSQIESSYEFDGLNVSLEKAQTEYTNVIRLAKSYAVGDAEGVRENENYDNSKYYSEQSSRSAGSSATSASKAATSEELAEGHMHNALTYSQNAQTYMNNAQTYMNSANTSETNAKTSEVNSKTSETNAKTSETKAKTSETNASKSETNAKTSENNALTSQQNAKESETNALDSANKAQSYAVGGTGTRGNEDYDNARYYYELTKNIVAGLDGGFVPMGTIAFSGLASAAKETGYVYNISDDFVTDESFAEGEGKSYTAGTNVYCRSDGLWDCFGGAASPTATVSEVKDYLGI